MMPRSLASLPLRVVGRRNVATLVLRAVASTPPSVMARVAGVRRFHASSHDDGKPSSKTDKITHSTFLESIDLTNPGADDRRKLSMLIQEVVHTKANAGDFVPRVVIGNLCTKYQTFDLDEKKQFLLILARDLHVDPALVEQSLNYFAENFAHVQQDAETHSGSEIDWEHERIERFLRTFRNLRASLTPLYEMFFQQILSQREDGMLFLVHLRADLLQVLRKSAAPGPETSALRSLDTSLKSFLASWFSVGFLKLERVTYESSPGQLLEKIIRYEAVHPVGTIIELKRRLGRGRRCFAFFHPSVPDEPLVFVHIALVKELAGSMPYIKDATEKMEDETDARAAIFYSISSTQKGLQGVDLGNFLIKEVARSLKREHPQLEIFSTLSPMPNFVPWLESQRTNAALVARDDADVVELERALKTNGVALSDTETLTGASVVLAAIAVADWHEKSEIAGALKPLLLKLGARYIYHEKKRSKALCQVANFHIRNGAIFERINWLGDPSPKGFRQSAGLMVNYKYDLARVESNNENYLMHHTIALGDQPKHLLQQW